MRSLSAVFVALLLMFAGAAPAETPPGQMKGGIVYSLPAWFKSSFLDLRSSAGRWPCPSIQ